MIVLLIRSLGKMWFNGILMGYYGIWSRTIEPGITDRQKTIGIPWEMVFFGGVLSGIGGLETCFMFPYIGYWE